MMEKGEFRGDLFHRLNVLAIHIPPLRERTADVNPLIQFFLRKYGAFRQSAVCSVDNDFCEALEKSELPGNVRELENIVRRAILNNKCGLSIGLKDLPPEIWKRLSAVSNGRNEASHSEHKESIEYSLYTPLVESDSLSILQLLAHHEWNLMRALNHCEMLFLKVAYHHSSGNQSKTARLLGITPRSVYNKLKKHNIAH